MARTVIAPYLYDRQLYELMSIEDRLWMNKLYLAERLGYVCGPCGSNAPQGDWCVRPIMNLAGQGEGGFYKFTVVTEGVNNKVQNRPGYFWSEWFDGNAKFTEYINDVPTYTYLCAYDNKELSVGGSKVKEWSESDQHIVLPDMLKDISRYMTLEAIGDKIIEVTFRMIPDWARKEVIADYKAIDINYVVDPADVNYGLADYKKADANPFVEKGHVWEEVPGTRRQLT